VYLLPFKSLAVNLTQKPNESSVLKIFKVFLFKQFEKIKGKIAFSGILQA